VASLILAALLNDPNVIALLFRQGGGAIAGMFAGG
jgi:hypothetical protein